MGSTKSYTIITNGVTNKHIYNEDELQKYLNEGWVFGATKTKEQVDKWRKSYLNTFYSKSEEELQEWKNKNSSANRKRYENMTDEQKKQRSMNVSIGTKKMWDSLSKEDRLLREEHRAYTRDNWTDKERKQYCKNMSDAAKTNRATITSEEYHERSIKATETKKKNKTFSTSSYENIVKDLLISQYGEENIIYDNYIDSRYSTKCDFYVKSLDIFIELNIHPSHGGHPFNINNKDDFKLKESLELKNDKWSNMILDVWTNRDVKKLKEAINNKLNYIVVYPNDFDSFIQTIKEGNIWNLVNYQI